jgi:thymidylate synthase (FAD)
MLWLAAMEFAEKIYFALLQEGVTPQEARSVLPNSLKTEIIITANLREWRHILRLRTSKSAHPQIREIMLKILALFREKMPILFGDIIAE